MIKKELDFYHEAENAERFRRNFKDDPYVYIPKIYWDWTTDRVLVQERIKGIKITDIEGLVRNGCDPKIIARRGASLTLKQILVDGFFHADPHPGNIFVLPGNVIAPVDFGMAQRLDKRTKDYLKRMFKAILLEDSDTLSQVFSEMGMISDGELSGELEEDIFDLLQKYNRRSLQRVRVREFFNEINRLIRKYRINIPVGFLYLGKAVSTIESIGFTLDPDFETIPFARKFMWRFLREDGRFSIIEWIGEWKELLYRFPKDMSRALRKISEGETRLERKRVEKPKGNKSLVGMFILGIGALILLFFSPKIAIGILAGLLIWMAVEFLGG